MRRTVISTAAEKFVVNLAYGTPGLTGTLANLTKTNDTEFSVMHFPQLRP